MSAKCPKCRLEWHVLANADPLAKSWERFDPDYCPRCGRRIGDRKCGGCADFVPSDMSWAGGKCARGGVFRAEEYPSCPDWRKR